MSPIRSRRLIGWLLGGLVALAIVVVGGTWLYIHVIEGPAPAPLSLKLGHLIARGDGQRGQLRAFGRHRVSKYRISRQGGRHLAGGLRLRGRLPGERGSGRPEQRRRRAHQRHRGPSDDPRLDGDGGEFHRPDGHHQERSRASGTRSSTAASWTPRRYPTGTLSLTSPIRLGALPADGVIRTYHAAGSLTLHGRTRPVTFTLQAERTASSGIEVSGSIPVLFANWGIGNPSFAGFVTTQNHGLLEFLLKFSRS